MEPSADTYRHILYATDFGPAAQAIGARALDLAHRYKARLSLVHVVEYVPVDLSGDLAMPPPMEIEAELLKVAHRRLAELAAQLGIPDAPQTVKSGGAKREILDLAQANDVDLIVLGSHGRSGWQLLLGSTANAVLHGAGCDVLAVRVKH